MATMNPLEKKARSSFIKGMVVAGLIGILISVFLGYLLYKKNKEKEELLAAQVDVAVLAQEVTSGNQITPDMLKTVRSDKAAIPAGAITAGQIMELSTITDGEGNPLLDENGAQIAQKILAKINIPANSILTADMITTEEDRTTDDLREQEYNMIVLPTALEDGDTIDIRLRLPSGEDYIVLSKKKVKLSNLGESVSDQTIVLNVSEDDILIMDAVVVDAWQITGSLLYANIYTDPGMQNAASATYVPSQSTLNLMVNDPNIVTEAYNKLMERYSANGSANRSGINNALSAIDEDTRRGTLEGKVSESTAKQQEERRQYLDSLYGATE